MDASDEKKTERLTLSKQIFVQIGATSLHPLSVLPKNSHSITLP
jgi:hypothetical protein